MSDESGPMYTPMSPFGTEPPPPPPPISLADILNSVELIRQKEADDKASLERIGSATYDSLRSMLVVWASRGFPSAYTLMEVAINPPALCSDGVHRGLADYIVFCSGKSIQDHVALLQEKLVDIVVSYANMGYAIAIVVSKA
jgi:hypothetical protein